MGYTHYWYTHRDAPADAYGRTAMDAKRLFVVAAELGYDLAGWDGSGEPECSEGAIAFNGRAGDPVDQSYDSCRINAQWEPNRWSSPTADTPDGADPALDPTGWRFDCCKIGFLDPAGFRPYGDVVEALLARAKVHYGVHMVVASDGEWEQPGDGGYAWGTWAKGRDLYQLAYGEAPVCPFADEVDA